MYKLEANKDDVSYIATLTNLYLYLSVVDLIFAGISLLFFIFIRTHFIFIILLGISGALSYYEHKLYKQTIKRLLPLDNCYIDIGEDTIQISQVSDEGMYEFFEVYYDEVEKIRTLDGSDLYGVALYLKNDRDKSYATLDGEEVDRSIVPISFLGHEDDVFEKAYSDIVEKVSDDVEIDSSEKWKRPKQNSEIFRMSLLQLSLFIPYILSVLIFK